MDKDIIIFYENFSSIQKSIIQILGVNILSLRQKELLEILSSIKVFDRNNQPFSIISIRPILNELVDKDIITKNNSGISLKKNWQKLGFKKALDSKEFEEITKILLKKQPLEKDYPEIYSQKNIKRYERAIQLAFSSKNNISFRQLWADSEHQFSPSKIFYNYFANPFDQNLIDKLSIENRYEVIQSIFSKFSFNLSNLDPLLNYSYMFMLENPDNENVYEILSIFFLLGRVNEVKNVLKKITDQSNYSYFSFLGLVNAFKGNNDEALMWFESSLKQLRKITGKRKIFFLGIEGIFFIFCLLRTHKKEYYKKAIEYIDIIKKQDPQSYTLFQLILPLLNGRNPEDIYSLLSRFDIFDINLNFSSFFYFLILAWTDPELAKIKIDSLKKIKQNASKTGLKWIEAESYALLAYLGEDTSQNKKKALKIHKECGTKTITDIVQPVEVWEKKLHQLINLGNEAKKSISDENKTSMERLVWILDHNKKNNTASISPRLQKFSKKKWTKGRAVSLKTLYNNYMEMDFLTSQDQKICSFIKISSYYSSYYYKSNDYYFDLQKSLPALIGHPLIFTDENPKTPVELIKGEPEVRLKRQKEKFSLEITPAPPEDLDKILIIQESPLRFRLINFSPETRNIAEVIGKNGIIIPKEAQTKAIDAAAALSSLVTINSDLDIGKTKEIKNITSDPTPNIQIIPWNGGIQAEILVRPFADTGSYFKPGRGGINVFADINGKKLQTTRDIEKEKDLADNLISSCLTFENIEDLNGQWFINDPEDALELLLELKEYSTENKIVMSWPKGKSINIESCVSFDNLNLNIKKNRDWFNINGSFETDKKTLIDLNRIMELLDNSTGRFIEIDEKKFIAITATLKERLEELKSFTTPLKHGVKLNPITSLAMSDFFEQVKTKEDKAWKDHCKKLKNVKENKIPSTLQADLRDYQKEGFKWLSRLSNWKMGACLADDMGLGKTLQAISALLLTAKKGPSLVIAPVSVISNWEEEFRKFAPTLNPLVFGNGNREDFLNNLNPFDIVLSSYGLLQIEGDKLKNIHWQTVVLDEAQAIKNMKAKRTKAAMELKSDFRIITTGTPVENHLDELWTLFHFINPGLLGSFKRFKETFAVPIEKDNDKKASKRLKKLIRPFILRRMKTDVLKELPEKTEITLSIEMDSDERKIYEAQRLKAIEKINESNGEKSGEKHLKILAELTKLRQICCNPLLVMPEFSGESAKFSLFKKIIKELLMSNHKTLVFSQFTSHLKIIRKFLDKEKIQYQYLDGSTSSSKRKERINSFQAGEGDLFLISLKAGGFGLNLTAADYVIHMDPWWNPAVEDQASDRAHRIGQTRPVTVYRLVIKDSVEEKIVNLHKEKRELAQSLLQGSDTAGKLSTKDIIQLLKEG